jgi:restriction system protein
VILESSDGRTTGIQVKRLSDKIKVDQIRALVGALVIEGHCAGVFVTTSDYQRGCYVAADRASRLGLPITLVSGTQFLEALRIANQRSWLDYDLNGPPFTTTPLHLVCYRVGACSGPYQYVWESETPSR